MAVFLPMTKKEMKERGWDVLDVLLITGDDVTPPHNWREVAPALRELLAGSGRFDVKVCEDAGILDSAPALARYDLVLLAMYNAKTPTLSDAAKAPGAGGSGNPSSARNHRGFH